jgi:iron complex transport system substrate-binding protein
MKAILSSLALGGALGTTVACTVACTAASTEGGGGGEGAGATTALSVVDDRGRRLVLPGPARRIASLSPALTETLFALGCGHRVVLRDRASDFPQAAGRLPATDPFQLSPEHVAGYRPDLVLLSHAEPARTVALRRAGVAVAVLDPQTLARLYRDIGLVGRLCGAAVEARRLVRRLRRRVAAVRRRVADRRRPRVYLELDGSDPARPWTAGPGSLADELLSVAGGRNIFRRPLAQPYAQVGAEQVIRSDPEVVVVAVDERRGISARRLRQRPGWGQLSALRRQRVIETIPADLLSRPGPRLVEGIEALARALHPEVR